MVKSHRSGNDGGGCQGLGVGETGTCYWVRSFTYVRSAVLETCCATLSLQLTLLCRVLKRVDLMLSVLTTIAKRKKELGRSYAFFKIHANSTEKNRRSIDFGIRENWVENPAQPLSRHLNLRLSPLISKMGTVTLPPWGCPPD